MSWPQTRLGELVENLDAWRIPIATAKREPGPYPYYGASGVVDHVKDFIFEGEHLLVSEDGENLRSRSTPIAFLADGRFWVNNHAHVLRGRAGVASTRFLAYALATTDVSGYITGSAQPKLSRASLEAVRVPHPPLGTQQVITEILGALDDKIASNLRLATTASDLMVLRATSLPCTGRLGDLAVLDRTLVSTAELAEAGQVRHYSLPAYDCGQLASLEPGTAILSGKFQVSGPSVLLSKLNPRFPRIWDVPTPEPNAVASTEFLVLRPLSLPTPALWAVLANPRTTAYLSEHAAGTSGSHQRVRPDAALELPTPSSDSFPPRLLDLLCGLGARVQCARRESRTLAELRDTLLPKLMDGTLRVRDAEQIADHTL